MYLTENQRILAENCVQPELRKVKRKNKKCHKIITDFLKNLKRSVFTNDYIVHHRYKIEILKWLQAYYEDRAAVTPKEYLESILDKTYLNENIICNLEYIKILYFWVNFKEIRGF